jgi:hypothetical protein
MGDNRLHDLDFQFARRPRLLFNEPRFAKSVDRHTGGFVH